MTSDTQSHEGANYLPFEYLADFFRFMKLYRHVIVPITYDGLDWNGEYNPDTMYANEFSRWKNQIRSDRQKAKKIYVLVQFDVDSLPGHSMRAIELMTRLGLPGNFMIFNKRLNRQLLRDERKIEITSYEIDRAVMISAAEIGSTIGYHTNAMEHANHDPQRALEVFEEDLAKIRDSYPMVRHFSPHGGVPSPEGLNNYDIPIGESEQKRLDVRWAHNRRAPKFGGAYSDGGFANPKKDPDRLDLLAAVKRWRPGNRYRVLIHPQYFSGPEDAVNAPPPNVNNSQWFQRVWQAYGHREQRSDHAQASVSSRRDCGPIFGNLRRSLIRPKRPFVESPL